MKNLSRDALAAVSFSLAFCWAMAAPGEDFYKSKAIRLIVATTPGGGFDAYSRMLTRHMGKHIKETQRFLWKTWRAPLS
jgi:tripartite-type tricarboxylate transporter receptor subunit TctC